MKSKRNNRRAFTLIEMMVVIIILGILAAFVIPNITGKGDEAKQKMVCVQMKSIMESLKMFKLDNGSYPSTEEGLDALLANPDEDKYKSFAPNGYFEGGKIPNDPWKTPYIYSNDEGALGLTSLGSDGKEGGEKDAKDIDFANCGQ